MNLNEVDLYNLYNQGCSCKKDPIFEYEITKRTKYEFDHTKRRVHYFVTFKYLTSSGVSLCGKVTDEDTYAIGTDIKICSFCAKERKRLNV